MFLYYTPSYPPWEGAEHPMGSLRQPVSWLHPSRQLDRAQREALGFAVAHRALPGPGVYSSAPKSFWRTCGHLTSCKEVQFTLLY